MALNVYEIPGGAPKFGVAVGFTAEEGDEYSVELEGPPDDTHRVMKILEGVVEQSDLTREGNRVDFVINAAELQPLIFTAVGRHHIVLRDRKRKKVVNRHPLLVNLITKPEETIDADAVRGAANVRKVKRDTKGKA
jgi:hypothetical protein